MTEPADKSQKLRASHFLARWLEQQEGTIIPPWISAIQEQQDQIQRATPRSKRMEHAQLIQFFDGVVAAVRTGTVDELDVAVQELITERLGSGYGLTDFLRVADELKRAIWQVAQDMLSSSQMLSALTLLEPIFAHSTTQLAWLASRAAQAHLEEELAQSRWTLDKLDRTKSNFINIAAHELKTPLTLVQGYTAILHEELALNPDFKELLRGLENGIGRLQTIIQNMIDVSLIDSDVLTLSWQRVALADIVRLVIEDLEREASGRRLTIQIKRFPDKLKGMYLDSHRMYQVLNNLIGNAIKYTPDGGTITLGARVLQGRQNQEFVELAIADTGIGVAPEDMPHIFEKFYSRGDVDQHSTSKTQFKGGGPGLGLTIAKGIVEAHGGRIWAESPGYDEMQLPGSTFHVMLPIYHEVPERISERLLGLEKTETGGMPAVDMPAADARVTSKETLDQMKMEQTT
jgi:signal transduction histidine kinase